MPFDHTFHFLNSPKQWFVSKTWKKNNKKKKTQETLTGIGLILKVPYARCRSLLEMVLMTQKKTRVNSGLLYAVFLLPNPKFSQLNALAWTSSSPPP